MMTMFVALMIEALVGVLVAGTATAWLRSRLATGTRRVAGLSEQVTGNRS